VQAARKDAPATPAAATPDRRRNARRSIALESDDERFRIRFPLRVGDAA